MMILIILFFVGFIKESTSTDSVSGYELFPDRDCHGNDINKVRTDSLQQCGNLCSQSEVKCVAFLFQTDGTWKNNCLLKHTCNTMQNRTSLNMYLRKTENTTTSSSNESTSNMPVTSECEDGTYGDNCDKTCNCRDKVPCEKLSGVCPNGCEFGYWGTSCQERVILYTRHSAVTGVLSCVIVILLIALIVFVILYVRQRATDVNTHKDMPVIYESTANITSSNEHEYQAIVKNTGKNNNDNVPADQSIYVNVENTRSK